jgi:hypothetical protein
MTTTPLPWHGVDLNRPSRYANVRRIAGQLLADGRWHPWREVIDDVAGRCPDLRRATINSMLYSMIVAGDRWLLRPVNLHSPSRRSDAANWPAGLH